MGGNEQIANNFTTIIKVQNKSLIKKMKIWWKIYFSDLMKS